MSIPLKLLVLVKDFQAIKSTWGPPDVPTRSPKPLLGITNGCVSGGLPRLRMCGRAQVGASCRLAPLWASDPDSWPR